MVAVMIADDGARPIIWDCREGLTKLSGAMPKIRGLQCSKVVARPPSDLSSLVERRLRTPENVVRTLDNE